MALVNIKFHLDSIEWDLGVVAAKGRDIGSKGFISRSNIREMYLLFDNQGVNIDVNDRNFAPLNAGSHLSVWDCVDDSVAPIEYTLSTNEELLILINQLYNKQAKLKG
jgi:hypothetical protein